MIQTIFDELADLRLEVTRHPVFYRSWTQGDFRVFMEHHVVAVWDCMSLLKTLQLNLSHPETPWLPPSDPAVARALNSLILAGESGHWPNAGFTGSRFELYLSAMDEAGASTDGIERFLAHLSTGYPFGYALETSSLPAAVQRFTRNTFMICQKAPHEIAAALFFGRTEILPEVLARVAEQRAYGGAPHLDAYLSQDAASRAGELSSHARTILNYLCGTSSRRWSEASECAASALAARRRLWDDILGVMERDHGSATGVRGEGAQFDARLNNASFLEN